MNTLFSTYSHAKRPEQICLNPSNPYATHNTRGLLYHLQKIGKSSSVMLGHQSTNTLTRSGFQTIADSDVKRVCGQFPGMVSYDLGWIELNNGKVWLDGTIDRLIAAIKYCRELGLPVCLSWHARNPIDAAHDQKNRTAAGKVKDFGNTVEQVLTDARVKNVYLSWLDVLTDFFEQLVDETGHDIPVLFRPFHECSGHWFWWGNKRCSSEEYIRLYRLTHDYLTKEKGVDNLLWVYNTDKVFEASDFKERYPGDQYIDLLSIDFYDSPKFSPTDFQQALSKSLHVLTSSAKELDKGCFIAECGRKNYQEQHYFTTRAVQYFAEDLIACSFWANTPKNYYVSFPSDPNKEDFLRLIDDTCILMEKDVRMLNIFS